MTQNEELATKLSNLNYRVKITPHPLVCVNPNDPLDQPLIWENMLWGKKLWRKCGQTNGFLVGYQACYVSSARYLRKSKVPSVEKIRGSASPPIRCIRGYLALGGKIEYALDAIIDLASNSEDDDLEYDDDYQALPKTSLDDEFEIAKAMCIHFGGGSLEEKGPHSSRYQEDLAAGGSFSGGDAHRRDN